MMELESLDREERSEPSSIASRAVDWLRRKWVPNGVILLYHRIAEDGPDPMGTAVPPIQFEEHLQVLGRFGSPMALTEFLARRDAGSLPERPIVITFDGGYATTLTHAAPLLLRYGIPATAFVPSGMIGNQREYWWDELERLLLHPGGLPDQLTLTIDGTVHQWRLGAAAESQGPRFADYNGWRTWDATFPTMRHALYRNLWERLARLDDERREEVLSRLHEWVGDAPRAARESHRLLSWGELCQIPVAGGFDVGGQGMTRLSLGSLSPREQWQEVREGKALLDMTLETPVKHFAFPHRGTASYTRETIAFVQAAGYSSACTTGDQRIEPWTDPFELPRFSVYARDRESFATWLGRILSAG